MNKNTSDMNPVTRTILGYLAMAALIAGTIAVLSPSANAGNAYGKDDNPGQAKGHAVNGGPATPGEKGAKGQLASAMGSLNAAHASINGLKHANAKSRVGSLRGYMGALVAYEEKHPLYHEIIEEIGVAEDTIDGINDKISNFESKINEINYDISALSDDVAALDPESETYDADKAALGDQIADLEAEKKSWTDLKTEQEAALNDEKQTLADLEDNLDVVTAELNASITEAADNLKQAANKDSEIDATVVGAVNDLLDGKSAGFTRSEAIRETEEDVAKLINASE